MIKPDYMGIWTDSENKFKSYFFMCILEEHNVAPGMSRVTGVMEDLFGMARFKGQFIVNKIHFEKIDLHKGEFPIAYNGTKKSGIYEGTYIRDEGLDPVTKAPLLSKGTFILEKCPPSKTLELVLEHLHNKNKRGN